MDANELEIVTAERDVLRDMAGHLQMRLSEAHCAERNARDVLTLELEAVKEMRAERDDALALAKSQAARIAELEDALRNARMRLNQCEGKPRPRSYWTMSPEDVRRLADAYKSWMMPCRTTE